MLRGVAVMRRVACMKLPDPQSLNIQVVPPAPDPAKSTRDRFDIHATDAALRQLPQRHRPDRLRVRDVRRHGRAAPGRHDRGHVQGRAPGANGALTSVEHDQQHDDHQHVGVPQRLRRHVRRQQRAGDGAGPAARRCASAWPGSFSGRRRAGATTPCRNAEQSFVDHVEADAVRPAGQVRRGAGRLRPQPAVRPTERPVKKRNAQPAVRSCRPSAPARRRCRSTACSRTPCWRRPGEPLPLRFCGIYHPHGIATEYFADRLNGRFSGWAPTPRPTSTSPTRQRRAVRAAAVRRRRHLRQELQEQDPADRGHRPDVERQRARHGRHDPDRQLHRGRQAEELVARSVHGGRAKLGAATRVTSIAVGVGDDGTQAGTTLSFGPGGAPLPKIIDPVQAFNTLFSGFVPTNDPAAAAAAMRNARQGPQRHRLRGQGHQPPATRGWRRSSSRSWTSTWTRSATWRSSSPSRRRG